MVLCHSIPLTNPVPVLFFCLDTTSLTLSCTQTALASFSPQMFFFFFLENLSPFFQHSTGNNPKLRRYPAGYMTMHALQFCTYLRGDFRTFIPVVSMLSFLQLSSSALLTHLGRILEGSSLWVLLIGRYAQYRQSRMRETVFQVQYVKMRTHYTIRSWKMKQKYAYYLNIHNDLGVCMCAYLTHRYSLEYNCNRDILK